MEVILGTREHKQIFKGKKDLPLPGRGSLLFLTASTHVDSQVFLIQFPFKSQKKRNNIDTFFISDNIKRVFECLRIFLYSFKYQIISLFNLPGLLRHIVIHYLKLHLCQISDDYTSNICDVSTYLHFEICHF